MCAPDSRLEVGAMERGTSSADEAGGRKAETVHDRQSRTQSRRERKKKRQRAVLFRTVKKII